MKDVAQRMKQKQYENSVIDFVLNKGCFLVVTEDQTFLTVLRTVLTRHLALSQPDILNWVSEPGLLLKALKHTEENSLRPVLIMERHIQGRDLTYLVRQFKAAYPNLYVIVLTVDVDKERLMYLHEEGADNFIAKPVSANILIEKLAVTIKPQTKVGQLVEAGRNLLVRGQVKKARELALQVLEMKPGSSAAQMLLGDAQRKLGNIEEAKEAYRLAAQDNALFLEPLRKLAELAEEQGDEDTRLSHLTRLDELSPLNSERKVSMGEIYLNKGDFEKADNLFDAAVTQATKDALGHVSHISSRIASVYAEKNPAQSEQFLRRALTTKGNFLSRDDIRLFNQLGISLRQQGKWQEAIAEYKKALKVAPDDENLYYNMGMAHADGRQFQDAAKSMQEALRLNPQMPETSASIAYNMGLVFLQADAREQARTLLEQAVQLDPDMKQARAALARLG